ncbi:alpha-amylase family protein [Cellulomonas sp. P22]|uniref:alpha-amylase family protein n=1 Tax=Cellulomonas sp. P22 TaxID=3373189 RepID=UPI0037A8B2C1
MPAWVDHAIWWHAYPLGFTGAPVHGPDPEPGVRHRLARMVDWLDYVVELGCNGLLLGPVFASATHGYDTLDHTRIDERLGDEGDWDALVAAARARGVRLVLDGVFNHVGRDHPRVQAALAAGPGTEAGAWLRWSGTGEEARPEVFEGHDQLVVLNHDHPEVADHVAQVMTHWLDRGADGWRLDAVYAVPPAFWRAVLPRVRAAHPDVWVLGEMIHGDYAAYVEESGIDSVTQYELWKAVWSSLADVNLYELAWALDRHRSFLEVFLPQTFVGNHDVTRIADQVGDARHVTHALAVQLFVAGTPSVYAGDEQGFRGVKEERVGGDDAIRPEFPPTPEGLAPHGWPRYRELERLIGLRRRHPWLVHAPGETLEVGNAHLVLGASSPDGTEGLVLALNLGDQPWAPGVTVGDVVLRSGDPGAHVPDGVVAPHAWAVWRAQPAR